MTVTVAQQARLAMRRGAWSGVTVGRCPGFVQCNLVVLPRGDADEFRAYCDANPRACPIIDETEPGPGNWEPRFAAPGSDLRTDLARYTVYRHGRRSGDVDDIGDLWREDFVAFLLGSSLSFDHLLGQAGIAGVSEPWVMRTAIDTDAAGRFRGKLVVTMRFVPDALVEKVAELTSHYPKLHGGPVHIGRPEDIGAVYDPAFNSRLLAALPGAGVFWACGVTPQVAAEQAGCEVMITHKSGYGFITDLPPERLRV